MRANFNSLLEAITDREAAFGDYHYGQGFRAGWNAAIAGDDSAVASIDNRIAEAAKILRAAAIEAPQVAWMPLIVRDAQVEEIAKIIWSIVEDESYDVRDQREALILESVCVAVMKRLMAPSTALADVVQERHRQIAAEGWTPEHDDAHATGELALAAVCYVLADQPNFIDATVTEPPPYWPWSFMWWKPKDRRRNLVRAAALIAAEIERMDRASAPSKMVG
jgi:hypothetical protein